MRKISNNGLIRFYHGELENLYKFPEPDEIKARPGDVLRFLANKYEVGGTNYSDLRICLLPIERVPVTPILDRVPVVPAMGTVRTQTAESFTHFKFKVNSFVKDKYSQFVLKPENANPIFRPFGYAGDSMAELIENLTAHIEEQPNVFAITRANGSLMDVYLLNSDTFRLASSLSVELGQVSQTNQNSPRMDWTFLGSEVKGANKDYRMILSGNIVEGNTFTFDSIQYVATKDTTPADVIQYFTGGNLINALDTAIPQLVFDPGSVTRNNSNRPFISAFLDSISGPNDRYRINLTGSYFPGNVFTVSTSTRTVSHTWAEGDSISSVEAILNPDSGGFFTVPIGTQVLVKSAPGQRTSANNNIVQFALETVNVYPAATIESYGVLIGSDVTKGNRYKIIDEDNDFEKLVVATSSDDNFTIANQFSGENGSYFVWQRKTGPTPPAFEVSPGYAYTDEDIMDVSMILQPTVLCSDQLVVEIIVPQDIPMDRYILAIRDSNSQTVKSLAGIIDISDHPYTSLIEASDKSSVFGMNYIEEGLTQRIRADLALKVATPTITETAGMNIDGEEQSISTKIDYISSFSTLPIRENLARALMIMLKSAFVRINEDRVRISELNFVALSEYDRSIEMTGRATFLDEYVTNYDRFTYPRTFSGSLAVISSEFTFGLRLFVRNEAFTREVIGVTSIPADGYFLEVVPAGPSKGFVKILIRDQVNVLVEMEADRQEKSRSIPFRVQPGANVIIELIEVTSINPAMFYPVESVEVEVVYQSETTEIEGGGFGDGFDIGFD